jgi:hypothetical protein
MHGQLNIKFYTHFAGQYQNIRHYSRPVKILHVLTILLQCLMQVRDKILITLICKGNS